MAAASKSKLTFDLRLLQATHAVETHFRLEPSSFRLAELPLAFLRIARSLAVPPFEPFCSGCIA